MTGRARIEWWFSALCAIPWLLIVGVYTEARVARAGFVETTPSSVRCMQPCAPQQSTARKYIRNDLALVDYHSSRHQQVVHSYTRLHRFLECGVIADGPRVEHNNVGVGALLQPAFLACSGRGTLEHLRRHETHLSQRIHQRDCPSFAHILGQHTRVGSGIARMALEAIA